MVTYYNVNLCGCVSILSPSVSDLYSYPLQELTLNLFQLGAKATFIIFI